MATAWQSETIDRYAIVLHAETRALYAVKKCEGQILTSTRASLAYQRISVTDNADDAGYAHCATPTDQQIRLTHDREGSGDRKRGREGFRCKRSLACDRVPLAEQ